MLAGCLLIGLLYYYANTVRLPDLVGGRAEHAQAWAVQNNIYIEMEEEYNLEYNRGLVISQSPAAEETLFKGGSVNMVVSMGPDPKERIELPDFSTMNIYEIERWIEEYRAENVTINRVYDDTVPVNRFVKKEFRDPSVTEQAYRREDRMTITISRGPEVFEKDLEVPDFTEEPESEALDWANSTGVTVHVEHAYSDTVPESCIIKQSIAPKTKIAKNEELTVTVSKGKALYAPSFSGLSREEAQLTANASGVTISIVEHYHNNVPAGSLISQSVSPGTLLVEGQNTIVLYYSSGLPFIPDLAGSSESDVVQFFVDMNDGKAKLSYEFKYIYDGGTPKGTVIINTHAGTRVPVGTFITVTISKGGRVIIDDYIGLCIDSEDMENEITKLKSQGLKVIIEYVESDNDSGIIVGQSIEPGRRIDTAKEILILEVAN